MIARGINLPAIITRINDSITQNVWDMQFIKLPK